MADSTLVALLVGMSQVYPRIKEAFQDRYANPLGWHARASNLIATLHTELPRLPNPDFPETREVVAAAIRAGSSNRKAARQERKIADMGEDEFSDHVRTEYGFDLPR